MCFGTRLVNRLVNYIMAEAVPGPVLANSLVVLHHTRWEGRTVPAAYTVLVYSRALLTC